MAASQAFCDIVMKGGITSGIVYPRLVSTLAGSYGFKSIGGTSAGAIAAAAAAAAQFARLRDPESTAFTRLADLPDQLSEPLGSRGSRLLNLFQPTADNRPFFNALIAVIRRKNGFMRALAGCVSLLRSFWWAALAGAAPGVVLLLATWTTQGWYRWPSIWISVIVLLAGMLGATGLWAALRLGRTLPHSHFGLSTGMPPADEPPRIGGIEQPSALTPWFHRYLNEMAGLPRSRPLTFGDLWAGKQLGAADPVPDRSEAVIGLEIMTTCLTQGRPFKLPFETEMFFYRESQFRKLFPREVVQWMADHSPAPQPGDPEINGETLRRLPPPDKFPVLLAVRLSLSFPLLISAIPLYAVDWTRERNQQVRSDNSQRESEVRDIDRKLAAAGTDADARALREERARIVKASAKCDAVLCLFSDGGICSNFPLHMFDSPLPLWPTFAVNLKPFHPDYPGERVWLPEEQAQGIQAHFHAPEEKTGLGAIVEFIWSIVATMQNWRDNLLASAPGYRDRIVHISHAKEEGGLNLDMPKERIDEMAGSGRKAAEALQQKFAAPASLGWDQHRVTRLRSFLGLMDRMLKNVARAYPAGGVPTYRDLVTRVPPAPPRNYHFRSAEQRALAETVLNDLKLAADHVTESGQDLTVGEPHPVPELRITPRF